jgi:hypothetical protein
MDDDEPASEASHVEQAAAAREFVRLALAVAPWSDRARLLDLARAAGWKIEP